MPKLEAEKVLLGLLDQAGWDLRTNLPYWLVISVPAWRNVQWLAETFQEPLLKWASVTRVYFEYGNKKLAEFNAEGNLMSIQIDGLKVNRALLDVFGEMLSNPDRSLGIVRLPDERQISVSGGAGGKYLVGASIEEATQWRRADYWHPEDLTRFNQEWAQAMSVGGQWFEYRYRSFDPRGGRPDNCDFEFVSRYKLIQGADGTMFHYAENLDMIELARS